MSSLHLFRQILDTQDFLPQSDATRDLLHTIRYILRKFFKRVKEDPFVIIDALASKTRQKWKDLSSYHDDDEDGMNGQGQRIREKVSPAFCQQQPSLIPSRWRPVPQISTS